MSSKIRIILLFQRGSWNGGEGGSTNSPKNSSCTVETFAKKKKNCKGRRGKGGGGGMRALRLVAFFYSGSVFDVI